MSAQVGGVPAGAPLEPEESSRPPPLTIDGSWEPWYAWRPVKLYMSSRLAWLCWIHRRAIHRSGMAMWDYTDEPELHPDPPPGERRADDSGAGFSQLA